MLGGSIPSHTRSLSSLDISSVSGNLLQSLFPVPNHTISTPTVPVTLQALGLSSSQNSSSNAPADSLGPHIPGPLFHPVLNFEFLGAFDISDHLSLSTGFFQHPPHPTAATGLSSLCRHLSAVPALISSVWSPTHNRSQAFPIPTAPTDPPAKLCHPSIPTNSTDQTENLGNSPSPAPSPAPGGSLCLLLSDHALMAGPLVCPSRPFSLNKRDSLKDFIQERAGAANVCQGSREYSRALSFQPSNEPHPLTLSPSLLWPLLSRLPEPGSHISAASASSLPCTDYCSRAPDKPHCSELRAQRSPQATFCFVLF